MDHMESRFCSKRNDAFRQMRLAKSTQSPHDGALLVPLIKNFELEMLEVLDVTNLNASILKGLGLKNMGLKLEMGRFELQASSFVTLTVWPRLHA